MATIDETIRQAVQAYLARTGMRERKLGAFAVGDPSLVPRLMAGGSTTLHTADALLRYMDKPPIGPEFASEVEAFLTETGTGNGNSGRGRPPRTPPRATRAPPRRQTPAPAMHVLSKGQRPRGMTPRRSSRLPRPQPCSRSPPARSNAIAPRAAVLPFCAWEVASGTPVPTCWIGHWRTVRESAPCGTDGPFSSKCRVRAGARPTPAHALPRVDTRAGLARASEAPRHHR